MKLPLLLAAVCSLVCSSCQNVQWPWKKADAVADPYAVAGSDQYNTYPQQPNYAQTPAQDYNAPNYNNTYNTGGEQAQVYPASGAGAAQPSYNAGAPDWNAGASPPPAATSGGGGRSYTVVRGDTQYAIARRYGISVNRLQQANGLTSSNLQIGQRLRIP